MALPFTDKRRLLMLENKKNEAQEPLTTHRLNEAFRLVAEAFAAYQRRDPARDGEPNQARQLKGLHRVVKEVEKLGAEMVRSREREARIELRDHMTVEIAKIKGRSQARSPELMLFDVFIPDLTIDHADSDTIDEVAMGQAVDRYALAANRPDLADLPIPEGHLEQLRLVQQCAPLLTEEGNGVLYELLASNGPKHAASALVDELVVPKKRGKKETSQGSGLLRLNRGPADRAAGYGLFGVMLDPEDWIGFAVEALGGTKWHARDIFAHAMKQRLAEPSTETINGHAVRRYPNGDPIVDVNSSGDGGTKSHD
jgi:hypothetical protein